MRTIRIEATGTDLNLKVKSKWNRRFFGVVRVEQSWSSAAHRAYKTVGQMDREAELVFERWASNLNEKICLDLDSDEVKSVYEWGKELAELECVEDSERDSHRIRMYQIARMLIDAKLIWRGGPCWWREL